MVRRKNAIHELTFSHIRVGLERAITSATKCATWTTLARSGATSNGLGTFKQTCSAPREGLWRQSRRSTPQADAKVRVLLHRKREVEFSFKPDWNFARSATAQVTFHHESARHRRVFNFWLITASSFNSFLRRGRERFGGRASGLIGCPES